MMAIYGRPGEINCRPTSSLAMIELFSVDGSTRKHYSISYKQIDYEWTNSSLSSFSTSMVIYNSRRGFLLSNITNDHYICRIHLSRFESNHSAINITSDDNIIIHYTSMLIIYMIIMILVIKFKPKNNNNNLINKKMVLIMQPNQLLIMIIFHIHLSDNHID